MRGQLRSFFDRRGNPYVVCKLAGCSRGRIDLCGQTSGQRHAVHDLRHSALRYGHSGSWQIGWRRRSSEIDLIGVGMKFPGTRCCLLFGVVLLRPCVRYIRGYLFAVAFQAPAISQCIRDIQTQRPDPSRHGQEARPIEFMIGGGDAVQAGINFLSSGAYTCLRIQRSSR